MTATSEMRPAWTRVDLGALRHNLERLKARDMEELRKEQEELQKETEDLASRLEQSAEDIEAAL